MNAVITVVMPTAVYTCADGISCAEGGRFIICKSTNNIEKLVVDVRTTTIGHNNSPLMDTIKKWHIERYAKKGWKV